MSSGATSAQTQGESSLDKGRFARNVIWSWAGEFILIVCGFILPRFVNDHVGQERLGVWDFGWTMVGYLGLLTLGISVSVNRYVARYHAMGRKDLLNSAVSACCMVFLISGGLAMAITVGVYATPAPVLRAESVTVSG